MKCLVFDTGPIITLAMNNLLWIVEPLKSKFGGEFYITPKVKQECVDKPLTGKKFKFEALQVLDLIEAGHIKVYQDKRLEVEASQLLELSNKLFLAHDNYIRNVHDAEIEALVASRILDADAFVIDEFVTRSLIENPLSVKKRMERKLHLPVRVDKNNLAKFKEEVRDIKVIRSFEIITIAYEMNLFGKYLPNLPDPKKTLLEGLLWAVKLNGCSVTEQEIQDVMKLEKVI